MMKVYREGARRILAGQKKLSTILITARGAEPPTVPMKNVDSKADDRERPIGQGGQPDAFVENLRIGVDNSAVTEWFNLRLSSRARL
jgi:hypothetical protein